MSDTQTENIAVAHKDYDVRGGGELVARHLADLFNAPLYVGRRNLDNEPDEEPPDIREIDYSPLPDWLATRMIDAYGPLRSLAYQLVWQQQYELTDHDVVIMSGNEPLWYVPEDDQTVVAYTHSTPRWQYDLFHDNDGLLEVGYNYVARVLYNHNVQRPDLFVANSDLVARRIKQYWNIPEDQVRTVYPPVETHKYSPSDAAAGDYYLHLGRLADHKNIDEIVHTFNDLGYELRIAGKGPERERLEELADENVEFCGFVSEQRKRELMAGAKAHVYPAHNEDFGMVPVESMAAGTPVLGVHDGFTRFQIIDGKNGYTYERDGDHLAEVVQEFERTGVEWTAAEISRFATEHFSVDRFQREMQAAVEEAQRRSAINTDWDSLREDGLEATTTGDSSPSVRPDGGEGQ